jgi:hypothetical protein
MQCPKCGSEACRQLAFDEAWICDACRLTWTDWQQAEIEGLKSQLPEEMQECTIKFKKCPVGHGRLTATNWIDHGCQSCEIEALKPKWQTGKLPKDGWYWVRSPKDDGGWDKPKVYEFGTHYIFSESEWAGPLVPPEEE